MKPIYNVVTGERYERNGEEKTRWTNHGIILEGERDGKRRLVLKLNSMPVSGNFDGFFSLFPYEKRTRDDEADYRSSSASNQPMDDATQNINLDEIPF